MTEDKRKVHTDALETLGMIIDETAKRDAIHLAVEPVVAKERLHPGEHVNAKGEKRRTYEKDAIGIVDPFISKGFVSAGERFWLVLYPRQITSLRHVWEHPAFPASEGKLIWKLDRQDSEIEKSKKWIEDYVEEIKQWDTGWDSNYPQTIRDYNDLMSAANRWVNSNNHEWLTFNVDNELLNEESWHHYEIVTGIKLEEDTKTNFFSCAC